MTNFFQYLDSSCLWNANSSSEFVFYDRFFTNGTLLSAINMLKYVGLHVLSQVLFGVDCCSQELTISYITFFLCVYRVEDSMQFILGDIINSYLDECLPKIINGDDTWHAFTNAKERFAYKFALFSANWLSSYFHHHDFKFAHVSELPYLLKHPFADFVLLHVGFFVLQNPRVH